MAFWKANWMWMNILRWCSVIVRNNVLQRSYLWRETSYSWWTNCLQEYGSNSADLECLQNDVSQWELGGEGWTPSDLTLPVWFDPQDPHAQGPGLFNKIRSGLLMVFRPLCPWEVVWWLEFKKQHKPVFRKHVSQVLEFHSGFKHCSLFPYLSEIILSFSISLSMPQSTTLPGEMWWNSLLRSHVTIWGLAVCCEPCISSRSGKGFHANHLFWSKV